ncbi:MAG: hypothetical protein KJZ78_19940 [Bryobacteraceae bacterium]|nr:hypothetical protein [Bryobacteraceae bacterium]
MDQRIGGPGVINEMDEMERKGCALLAAAGSLVLFAIPAAVYWSAWTHTSEKGSGSFAGLGYALAMAFLCFASWIAAWALAAIAAALVRRSVWLLLLVLFETPFLLYAVWGFGMLFYG